MLKRFFGGKPDGRAQEASPSPAEAIAKLQETEGLLCQKRDLLEAKVEQQQELARQHAREKRDKAALAALRTKRLYEGQLGQLEQHIQRLKENQIMLEGAANAALVTEALRAMDAASRAAAAALDVDEVARLKDDIAERCDHVNQVGELLAGPMGTCADLVDDDELEQELQGLKDEAAQEDAAAAAELAELAADAGGAQGLALPSAPRGRAQRAAQRQTAEERELAELKAALAV